MAPTQANRLDAIEEDLQELRASIPSLREVLEGRIQDMVALHEELVWKSREENTKSQEELRNSLSVLTAEVRALMASKEGTPTLPTPQNRSSQRSQIFLNGGGFEMPTSQRFPMEDRPYHEPARQRRMDFPAFNGENPDGWVAKAEHYFSVYGVAEVEKVATAVLGLEGRAVVWWQWVKQRKSIGSWGELKSLMLHHFRPHGGGSLCEQWMSIVQEGSVAEHSQQFILLASPLTHMPEDALVSCFIKGLKPLIRVELRL